MICIGKIFEMQLMFGIVFFLLGIIILKFPPKTINEMYGYRTKNSMSSIEKWNFAQKHSSKLIIKLGLFQIFFSCLGIFFDHTVSVHISVGIISALLTCVILFYVTEKKLKLEFP
ncbi:MAG: SdpI family protein [Flavobacterium sp.]|nr:SdpI family protein [Flavobacterium sp.]